MTEKLPTINIKGKEYVQVKDRIIYFNENYQNGSITTELLSDLSSKLVIVKATVIPDVKEERKFTGYSQATIGGNGINATAALENCETSAVGRALGMMGIGVIESVASADEVVKAQSAESYSKPKKTAYKTESYDPSKSNFPGNGYTPSSLVKWSKAEQNKLIESGKYKILDYKKKDGTVLKQLVNEIGQFSWLNYEIADYLSDKSDLKSSSQLKAVKEVFGVTESPAAKANREVYQSL